MRNIQCRAKEAKSNKWVYGYYVDEGMGQHTIVNFDSEKEIQKSYTILPETLAEPLAIEDINKNNAYTDQIVIAWNNLYTDKRSPMTRYKGVLKFGEYEQDASGGEYGGASCLGFYLETQFVQDEDDEPYEKIAKFSEKKTCSILEFDEFEIIGNTHDNSELLELH